MRSMDTPGLVAFLGYLAADLPDSTAFVEIGAHAAEWSSAVAETRGPATPVIAFEASPANYQAFVNDVDPRVKYVNAAICDHDGTIDVMIPRQVNGAHVPEIMGNHSLQRSTLRNVEYAPTRVPSWRLDSFLEISHLADRRLVLWVDVEGAQSRVIDGATAALGRTDLLLIEVEDEPYWEGQALAGDVDARLTALGLVPIARDHEYPKQYNVLYASRQIAAEVSS